MSTSLNDYFASEAGEYLDQLERLCAAPSRPDTAQLLRLVHAVRGAAELARHPQIAAVAARLVAALEGGADAAGEEALRSRVEWTVSDLQQLVRAAAAWGPAEDMRVHEALRRWDDAEPAAPAGPAVPAVPAPAAAPAAAAQPIPAATATDDDAVVSITRFFYDDAGPHVLDAPAAAGAVPIESLLLKGDAALREALALRADVERLLGAGASPELRAALDEVWELVRLGQSTL
jgi:HPt (histidine-containing phosphotransfer) domain-containing protein